MTKGTALMVGLETRSSLQLGRLPIGVARAAGVAPSWSVAKISAYM